MKKIAKTIFVLVLLVISASMVYAQTKTAPSKSVIYGGGTVAASGGVAAPRQPTFTPPTYQLQTFTPQPLIRNQNKCGTPLKSVDKGSLTPNVLCQPSGEWIFTAIDEDTVEKLNPLGDDKTKMPTKWKCDSEFQNFGCCPQTKCWNGKECVVSGKFFPNADDVNKLDKGFECNNGNWREITKKTNYDNTDSGFCARENQCLVTSIHSQSNEGKDDAPIEFFKATSKSEQPRCIADKQYLKDEYCNNGNWTTRTKLIAVQLLSLAEQIPLTEYDLFCDNYENTLNTVPADARTFIQEGICQKEGTNKQVPCVNNFCILKKRQEIVALGTSLNTKINSVTSFLKALKQNEHLCDNALNGHVFAQCSPTSIGQVWFNPDIESIIYLPSQLTTNLDDKYTGEQLKQILNYVVTKSIPGTERDFEFFKQTRLFEKWMFSKKDQRGIFAVMERQSCYGCDASTQKKYIGVKYTGFNITKNLCFLFTKEKIFNQNAVCANQTAEYDFVILSKDLSDPVKVRKWQDLTAKLRLVAGPLQRMSTGIIPPVAPTQLPPQQEECP